LKSTRTVILATVVIALFLPFAAFGLLISSGATAPSLGTASPFAILAATGITNTGTTSITGSVGSYPTPSETGFGTVTINLPGINYPAGAPSTTQTDLGGAITTAEANTPTTIGTALDGQSPVPGVYRAGSTTFTLSGGVLTLNGQGNPASVWIFQAPAAIAGALTTTGGSVVLTDGADSCNVFWVTSTGGAIIGTGTTFVGTIMAYSSVTLGTGATLQGAALANTGDVTMAGNTISTTCITAPIIPTTTTTTHHIIIPIISRVCSTTTPPNTTSAYLTVNTQTTSGAPVQGLLILCNSENLQLTSTVYSPAIIALDSGTNHTIGVDDSACYVFAYWLGTGSTNRFMNVSITSNTTVTAVFRDVCVPTPAGYSTIGVGTYMTTAGNASLGLYATLWQNGKLLQSCYTTCAFTVPNGQSYQVVVNNYGNYYFEQWTDGVMSSSHAVTVGSNSSNIVLTAVYGFSLSLPTSQLWAVNEGLASGATCEVGTTYNNQSSALTTAQNIVIGSPDMACGTMIPVTYVQVLYQNVNSGGGWIVFWHNP
jgi:Ice-binding-like